MDDPLRPVQPIKKIQSNIDKFESLSLSETSKLRPNNSKSKRSILDITSTSSEATDESPELRPSIISSHESVSSKQSPKKHKRYDSAAFSQKSYLDKSPPTTLPDDAREILKSQPEPEDLLAVLQYLQHGIDRKHDFNVRVAGPKASQIIAAIVTKIIPDYWHLYRQPELSQSDSQSRNIILSVLQSVPGIGALLLQLKQLSAAGTEHEEILLDTASALASVITSSSTLRWLLQDTLELYAKQSMRHAVWQEVVALFAGSKILSTASQALQSIHADVQKGVVFLIDGSKYAECLARNISAIVTKLTPTELESWTMISQVAQRGLNLGYRDAFVSEMYSTLLLGSRALWTPLRQLVHALTSTAQRTFLDAMLRDLTRKYLRAGVTVDSISPNGLESDYAIGGVAAIVSGLIEGNKMLDQHLLQWLTSTTGEYASLGLDTRRALIATLALSEEKLHHILEKSLATFGDRIEIQHSPILQQETTASTILLVLGYLHRLDANSVKVMAKQSVFLQTTSNRLAASVPRARFIGMVIATAVSKLADAPDKVINFGVDELEEEAAQKWFDLVHINDQMGSIKDLKHQEDKPVIELVDIKAQKPKAKQKKATKPPPKPASKIIAIEEIDSSSSEDDDDLPPYDKPDSDPSDSEDDPTLIDRSKPSAPVYIIDLISQLSTNDKPDTVSLALRTAPSLIRRKANFGTELSENATPLASALINLREGSHEPEMHQLRLQALIACIVSCPRVIGPWAAALYFDGDMALDQRASLLSMLGLGARELSGYQDDESTLTTSNQGQFPSQRLPFHLATLYTGPTETIAQQIEHATIRPLALAAADKATGPDILKIRTFSSRMEVEKKRIKKQEERTKRIPRDLHKLLTEGIYLPLCCRMSLILSSNVGVGRSNIFEPNIMRLFLQTLTIVLVCLGPNAVQLGDVSRETLVLLTSLHDVPKLAVDAVVLPALLQLLLTVVDLNVNAGVVGEERLAGGEVGEMVAELVSWSGRLEGSGLGPTIMDEDGTGMPWNVLVAGIQVKWHEVGRKYQGRMLGLMGGEMDDF